MILKWSSTTESQKLHFLMFHSGAEAISVVNHHQRFSLSSILIFYVESRDKKNEVFDNNKDHVESDGLKSAISFSLEGFFCWDAELCNEFLCSFVTVVVIVDLSHGEVAKQKSFITRSVILD